MAGLEVLLLQSLPLGFRFRPTDQELVNHYLKRKINGRIKSDVSVIPEIDVCKWEPWDLPDKSLIRSEDPEWFFFAPRDRKYQNGRRSNRATEAGYWKATGKDRTIKSRPPSPAIIGMKKTLVFYRGRAPKGERTNWIMHEYRTTEPEFESSDQGGYVLCRLFKKPEEKTLNSNAEEAEAMESSGFSPSKSSLDDSVHGEEALPGKADKTIAKLDSPSNSNITSDIGFQKADFKFDNSHTLMDSHMPCPSFDDSSAGVISKDEDADRDSISDFLDAILSNPEDETIPETSQALARPAEVLPKVRSIRREHPLDTFSAIDRVICNDLMSGDLWPFEDQNLESGDYLDNLLSNFSYSDDFGAQEFLPMDFYHDNDNCESIQELMSQLGASSGLDVSQDTCETILDPTREEDNGGIGIKIRDRRLQDFYVGQQGITDQGHAYRRMRLQKSLHTVSLTSGHNESAKISSKRDSNADVPEVGENSELISNAEVRDSEEPTSLLSLTTESQESDIGKFTVKGISVTDIDDTASSPQAEENHPNFYKPEASNHFLRLTTNQSNDLSIKLKPSPLDGPRVSSVSIGRVTLIVPAIILVMCVGLGWYFSS